MRAVFLCHAVLLEEEDDRYHHYDRNDDPGEGLAHTTFVVPTIHGS